MKLRNKKTGEIIDIKDVFTESDNFPNHYIIRNEWEDYEEPNYHYCLDGEGKIIECHLPDEDYENEKQIGNYFENKEEAEKAVEKLKAWKRLKDKGFRFKGWNTAFCEIDFDVPDSFYPIDGNMITNETEKDLDLLFGGEE